MLRTWQVQVTHPRYLGLFNPAVTLPSVIAETLVAMYNSQLANWRTSPAGNEIERHTLSWLAAKFGLPGDTIATFTSGGSEANLSAVAVALSHAFPEYGEHGLGQLVSASVFLSHRRGELLVQQDRAHERDRAPCGSPSQDRPPAEARLG